MCCAHLQLKLTPDSSRSHSHYSWHTYTCKFPIQIHGNVRLIKCPPTRQHDSINILLTHHFDCWRLLLPLIEHCLRWRRQGRTGAQALLAGSFWVRKMCLSIILMLCCCRWLFLSWRSAALMCLLTRFDGLNSNSHLQWPAASSLPIKWFY